MCVLAPVDKSRELAALPGFALGVLLEYKLAKGLLFGLRSVLNCKFMSLLALRVKGVLDVLGYIYSLLEMLYFCSIPGLKMF